MIFDFEDYEIRWEDRVFVIDTRLECHLVDEGFGYFESGSVRGNHKDLDISDILIIDWNCFLFDREKDDFYLYNGDDEESLKEIFIEHIAPILKLKLLNPGVIDV